MNKEYLIKKTSISLKRTKIFQKGKHHFFLEKPIKKATIIFHFTDNLICNNTKVTDLFTAGRVMLFCHNQHDISVLNT